MIIKEIIDDLTSKDVTRIRRSGLIIIRKSQDESEIEKIIPYKTQIEKATKDLVLGGVFASNNRFFQFPLEIIAFHQELNSLIGNERKCTCQLYLSKTYESFNPEQEAENESIQLKHKINGTYTYDYEIECLKCGSSYYVSEREYHYTWWKWTKITETVEFTESGQKQIDDEAKFVLCSVATIIRREVVNINELNYQKERIFNFRMKLGTFKGTEYYEGQYGWTECFENLNKEIEQKIKIKNER